MIAKLLTAKALAAKRSMFSVPAYLNSNYQRYRALRDFALSSRRRRRVCRLDRACSSLRAKSAALVRAVSCVRLTSPTALTHRWEDGSNKKRRRRRLVIVLVKVSQTLS